MRADFEMRKAACEAVLAQMDELVGLRQVKEELRKLSVQAQMFGSFPGYLAFAGDPGTGKTAVAHILGKLLHACGVLPTDRVVSCSRSSLIAGYIGQTAVKTRQICQAALGGVLLVDNAWQLAEKPDASFEKEALSALLAFGEEHRGEICMVFTFYPEKLRELLDRDPWFIPRLQRSFRFPALSPEELTEIFVREAGRRNLIPDEAAKAAVTRQFAAAVTKKGFGNGREAKQLLCLCEGNTLLRLWPQLQESHTKGPFIMTAQDVPQGQEE